MLPPVTYNAKGMTLVELMIALLIGAIILTSVLTAFESQNKSATIQDQVVEMQQNLRAGINLMASEIRMAGYNPTGATGVNKATIVSATPDAIYVSMDLNEDGDLNDSDERVRYGFSGTNDPEGNGIAGTAVAGPGAAKENMGFAADFGRATGTSGFFQPMAEYIQAVSFAYAYDADGDGELDTDGGQIIWAYNDSNTWRNLDTNKNGKIDSGDIGVPIVTPVAPATNALTAFAGTNTGTAVDLEDIRAIRIWLLARSARTDKETEASVNTFVVGNKVITANDQYRRRLLEISVQCRNMGLD